MCFFCTQQLSLIIMKSTKYSALFGSHGDGCLGDGHLLQHLLQTHSRHILTHITIHILNTWVCEGCCKIKKELRLLGQTTDDDQMKPSAQNASSIVGRAKDSSWSRGLNNRRGRTTHSSELVRARATIASVFSQYPQRLLPQERCHR